MGLITSLISLSFKLILVTSFLLVGLTLLPDRLFGDLTFDAQSKVIIDPDVPANVNIIRPTLNDIKKLELDRQVLEPESLKFHKNFLYTGTVNGQIVKIDEKTKKVSVLTNLVDQEAKNCENVKIAQENCGRALDLEIVGDILYAVDTFHGFIEYDLAKNTKKTYDLRDKIPGYEATEKLFNSIRQDPINSNIVYLSISSTKYGYNKISFTFLELESSGMVIAFNKLTKQVTIIAENLALANGLEVTDDKKSLLANELCNQRILKFDLKEVNSFVQGKGNRPKFNVFKDRIPGLPDNLTKHKKNILAALFFYKPTNDLFDQLTNNVHLRKVAHRLLYLGSETLKLVKRYYKCSCLDKMQHSFESGKILMNIPYKSAVGLFDQNTGDLNTLVLLPINYITHAIYNQATGSLYFGSVVHKEIHTLTIEL